MRVLFVGQVYKAFKTLSENINESENLKLGDFEIHSGKVNDSGLWKHIILKSIMSFAKKIITTRSDVSLKNKNIIVAVDSKSFRKDLDPLYKANRKRADSEQIFWDTYFKIFHEFLGELQENFVNWRIIKSDMAEADDVIAVLIQERFNNKNDVNFIISGDKDFRQIMEFDLDCEVGIYDPMKECFMEREDHLLMKMIIMGDRVDNIPPVKHKIGPKTAEKIIKENRVPILLQDSEAAARFNLNKALISLKTDDLPFFIKEEVLRDFDEYEKRNKNDFEVLRWVRKFYRDQNDIINLI
jgi:5'-3' exonuclease